MYFVVNFVLSDKCVFIVVKTKWMNSSNIIDICDKLKFITNYTNFITTNTNFIKINIFYNFLHSQRDALPSQTLEFPHIHSLIYLNSGESPTSDLHNVSTITEAQLFSLSSLCGSRRTWEQVNPINSMDKILA